MARVRTILDTNVLWDRAALERILASADDVIVPAIVFTERARQLVREGRGTAATLGALLERLDFVIEPFAEQEGGRYAAGMVDDERWRRLARDAMIAGHVRPSDTLLTHNVRDFLDVGVPASQVVAP